ncbi:ABC transporter substrate-binding protein [Octadecabacter sp. 1_MG-2023]|uniref:ABC transporter substrate-binding protein n=1 Tax=unclassified Octadecabacter TaxID=196158 RepID=UPI001C09C1A4|nr:MULTISPECIES: ABC transporter substrate-binding protein [unclassified Octadecabacter]MBU2991674.1 ABC transporter substrate-binding protein [Octadecabacter sp. B2R22]MDO6735647.1 ABC transporter substrate-binding protein [Octadecabacter sp. 1_MG-2023]
MRYLALLALCLAPLVAMAQDWEDQRMFGAENADTTLRILSSTDTSFFAPIIDDFIAANPAVSVEYLVTGTADLNRIFRETPNDFDVVISSAMDLQLKLANDGFAARLFDVNHPDWAQWHDSLFAFTSEPAAIVVNRSALGDLPIPNTRQDLIQLMRDNPDRFQSKVGTYDVRQSGLGYLFATQDARASETFWRLTEVMGRINARLYCCSGQMIDDLISGDLIMAYNVLGSYAQVRAESSNELLVILPSEFPTTMMRTVLASRGATDPLVAEDFIRHLLTLQANGDPTHFPLPPLSPSEANEGQTTIALNPALMTYLDQMKRSAFIREWEDAIVQDE